MQPKKGHLPKLGRAWPPLAPPVPTPLRASLTFDQLKEVLMDVEVQLNNRPLGYMEDDIESLPLTPNTLIHGANISLPEEDLDDMEEDEVKRMSKRAKYIQRCKDTIWKRWTTEYIRSLRERRLNQTGKTSEIRGQWKIGVIQEFVKGRDGVIRGAKLKTVIAITLPDGIVCFKEC